MIVSTGIDIVEVYRIAETMTRTPRFAERVFTESERAYCDAKGAAAARIVRRPLCREGGVSKALQTGWRGKITWQDVEILSNEQGVPSLNISGEAADLFKKAGVSQMHVSISHTSEHAVAFVIFER